MENLTQTTCSKLFGNVDQEDLNYEFSCSPCREEDANTKAIFRCINCQENFCESCVQLHNKILKSHTLIERRGVQTGSTDGREAALLGVTCDQHPLEILKMFCENHDTVCCTVCIALDHRLCDRVHYVPNIAKGISDRKIKDETLKLMNDTEKDLESLLSRRQDDLKHLSKERECINKNIEDFTDRLIARIKELQREASNKLQIKYENIVRELKNDISSFDASLDRIKMIKSKIENSDFMSESQIFVQIKIGKKESMKAWKQCELGTRGIGANSLDFEVNSNIESYLNSIESIGYISDERKSKASLLGEFDIGLESETKNPNIYGVCLLDNNEIVLADNSNLKLKRIGTEYQILDSLDLGATPYGICKTGHSEVAVTLPWLHKIQFVSIGKRMVANGSFSVDEICRGLCCHEGNLFICCNGSGSDDPGHVIVSDMTGCLLRIIKTNKDKECLFTSPQNVCFTEYDACIHVADIEKGIVTVDQHGSLISKISDKRLNNTLDICTDGSAKIFLCGYSSNNIIQVDKNGKLIHEILGKTELSKQPLTVSFLRKPSRLLITSEGSSVLKIFKLD